MRKTFYRPTEINHDEYGRITRSLEEDLSMIVEGAECPEETLGYARNLVGHARTDDKNTSMAYWGYLEPAELPADARVDYLYRPTYLAVCILANVLMRLPSRAVKIEGFYEVLRKGLNAATGRRFEGAGYESVSGLIDTLSLFAKGKMFSFAEAYPEVSESFTDMLLQSEAYIATKLQDGRFQCGWGEDCIGRVEELMVEITESRGKIKVFVYGTLMRGRSNHRILEGSHYLGSGSVGGYSMYDLGSYPGVKLDPNGTVLGELYEVDGNTLMRLNELEGEGNLYELDYADIVTEEGTVHSAGIYVYLHEVYIESHVPTELQPWRRR